MKKTQLPFLIIFIVLIADQILKYWVKTSFTLNHEVLIFNLDWARLHFTENKGMAFGLELGGAYGKIILTLFRIVAVIFIGYYLRMLVVRDASFGLIASISLIFAGALGNILDSVFYGMMFSESTYAHVAELFPSGGGYASVFHGKVVDMLYFPIWSGHYPDWFPIRAGEPFLFFRPVFNLADSAITIGVLTILLFQRRYFTEPQPEVVHSTEGNDSSD